MSAQRKARHQSLNGELSVHEQERHIGDDLISQADFRTIGDRREREGDPHSPGPERINKIANLRDKTADGNANGEGPILRPTCCRLVTTRLATLFVHRSQVGLHFPFIKCVDGLKAGEVVFLRRIRSRVVAEDIQHSVRASSGLVRSLQGLQIIFLLL